MTRPDPAALADLALETARLAAELVRGRKSAGVSVADTKTSDTDVVTEARPGVYVFGDAQQWELGTMAPDSLALTCRATVVSHAGGRLVLASIGCEIAVDELYLKVFSGGVSPVR